MATLEIEIDDSLKNNSDTLFTSLGFDTASAVQIFLRASQEHKGFPFPINDYYSDETLEAIEDVRQHRNLSGPYESAEEAVAAMLEEQKLTSPYQDRVKIAESLFGILPQTMTLDEAREERLKEI